MAKSRTTETTPSNPDVRYERGDIDLKTVVVIGVVLSLVILILSVATVWFGRGLARAEDRRKKTTLPPAAVDTNRLPPQPRLEALDDLREGKVELRPSRKPAISEAQEKPIDDAIRELPALLRWDKKKRQETGGLPSKASSGRVGTGGK
jgi:hypothetical protein